MFHHRPAESDRSFVRLAGYDICSYNCGEAVSPCDVDYVREYEWDTEKALRNLHKHGVPFPVAVEVFADPARIEMIDDSDAYGETRWLVIGWADQTVLVVVYTLRGDRWRIISARKANAHERESYWLHRLSS
ncbi:BrnT family toxin [Silvibacterium dinghuense]|uniref:BrnT family toxin n=2 Tax=Silvibacterium dinghuense TaxID=1560006 RepID=A0A4Q1SCG4_9BACT|nr:BrnT family toxin [Silvibacterium dinghuense]